MVRSFAGASSSFEACLTHVGTYPVFSRARTGGFLYHTLTNPTAPTSAAKAKASFGSWAAAMIDDDRSRLYPWPRTELPKRTIRVQSSALTKNISSVPPSFAVSLQYLESRNCSLTLSRFRRGGRDAFVEGAPARSARSRGAEAPFDHSGRRLGGYRPLTLRTGRASRTPLEPLVRCPAGASCRGGSTTA